MMKPQQLQRFEDGKTGQWLPLTAPPIRLCTGAGAQVRPSSRLLLLWIATGCGSCSSLSGFDAYNLVIVNQFAGGLVQGIQSAISNFRVESGYL